MVKDIETKIGHVGLSKSIFLTHQGLLLQRDFSQHLFLGASERCHEQIYFDYTGKDVPHGKMRTIFKGLLADILTLCLSTI